MTELGEPDDPRATVRSHLEASIHRLDEEHVGGAPIGEVVEAGYDEYPRGTLVLEELVEMLNTGRAYCPAGSTIRLVEWSGAVESEEPADG